MTDNDIIKALECCSKGKVYADCEKMGCPLYLGITLGCKYVDNENKLNADALELINRQQTVIERLRSMNQAKLDTIHDLRVETEMLNSYIHRCESGEEYWVKCLLERPKEAVKEFAERLVEDIDNLVKEMVGECG